MVFQPLSAADLDRHFQTQAQCLNARVLWETVPGAVGYRLNYRALPATVFDPWQSIDLAADQNSFSADLWDGAHYEVYLQALGANTEVLDSSSIARIRTGHFLLPPIVDVNTDGLQVRITWNRVDGAAAYGLSYAGAQQGHRKLSAESLSFKADLWPGAHFHLALYTLGPGDQISDPSQVHQVYVGAQPDPTDLDLSFTSPFPPSVPVQAARPGSPYASVLQDCIYSESRRQSCSLARLPLLGQDYPAPDISSIMDRLLVSDSWMAQRFQQVLERLPTKALRLFRAVTGIVIARDIQPAYYWSMTGGIYLNPDVLWLTESERDTLSRKKEDPRQRCGTRLSYSSLIDYRIGSDWSGLSDTPATRTLEQITHAHAPTLLHELAHANDFFPPRIQTGLSRQQTVAEATFWHLGDRVSHSIQTAFPLHSAHLKHLARVRFSCANANCALVQLTPEQWVDEFRDEAANSDYSYFSKYEDVAMIAEQILMSYFFKADRLHLLTEKLVSNRYPYIYWGRMGVNGNPAFRAKARRILGDIFPDINFSDYINRLPPAVEIPASSWSELVLPGPKTKAGKPAELPLKRLHELEQLPYR